MKNYLLSICILFFCANCVGQKDFLTTINNDIYSKKTISDRDYLIVKLRKKLFNKLQISKDIKNMIFIENIGIESFDYSGIIQIDSFIYSYQLEDIHSYSIRTIKIPLSKYIRDNKSINSCILSEVLNNNLKKLTNSNGENYNSGISFNLILFKDKKITNLPIKNICFFNKKGEAFYDN